MHVEHIESEDVVVPYWHVQNLWIGEARLQMARGIRKDLAVQLDVPFRVVRDRIRFEDLLRQPYTPPAPDVHHRNETLAHFSDASLALQWARVAAPWTIAAGAGVSLPIGRAESNPFALGRAGLPHQHIQFGTGTVDPALSLAASRRTGDWSLTASASARLTLAQNSHGYRAGDRFGAALGTARALPRRWALRGGLEVSREEAEKWDGRIEEEGNLGRTDLFALLGLSRSLAWGTWSADVRLPVLSHSESSQVKLPVIVHLGLSR